MVKETRKKSFEFALRDEGEGISTYGGGLKKYGLDLEVLKEFHPSVSAATLRLFERRHALRHYASTYWRVPACDDLAPGLDYFVFDTGLVCGGPRVAASWVQLLAGPAAQGTFEGAISYVNGLDLETAISGIEFYRRRRFRSHPHWGVLGPEWTNRTNRAKRRALELGAVPRGRPYLKEHRNEVALSN